MLFFSVYVNLNKLQYITCCQTNLSLSPWSHRTVISLLVIHTLICIVKKWMIFIFKFVGSCVCLYALLLSATQTCHVLLKEQLFYVFHWDFCKLSWESQSQVLPCSFFRIKNKFQMVVNRHLRIVKLLYEVTAYTLRTSRDSSVLLQYLVIQQTIFLRIGWWQSLFSLRIAALHFGVYSFIGHVLLSLEYSGKYAEKLKYL